MSTGLRQKYIEDRERPCEYDAEFLDKLRGFKKQTIVSIVTILEDNAEYLPQEDGWVQEAGCVIKLDKPFFFVVRYLHQFYETPLYLEIEEIECDDYLDFILQEKILIDLN